LRYSFLDAVGLLVTYAGKVSTDSLAEFADTLVRGTVWRGWPQTQEQIVDLIADPASQLADECDRQLRRRAMRFVCADPQGQEAVRQALTPARREHLTQMLRHHPGVEQELHLLPQQIAPAAQDGSKVQINTAVGEDKALNAVRSGQRSSLRMPRDGR